MFTAKLVTTVNGHFLTAIFSWIERFWS